MKTLLSERHHQEKVGWQPISNPLSSKQHNLQTPTWKQVRQRKIPKYGKQPLELNIDFKIIGTDLKILGLNLMFTQFLSQNISSFHSNLVSKTTLLMDWIYWLTEYLSRKCLPKKKSPNWVYCHSLHSCDLDWCPWMEWTFSQLVCLTIYWKTTVFPRQVLGLLTCGTCSLSFSGLNDYGQWLYGPCIIGASNW